MILDIIVTSKYQDNLVDMESITNTKVLTDHQ